MKLSIILLARQIINVILVINRISLQSGRSTSHNRTRPKTRALSEVPALICLALTRQKPLSMRRGNQLPICYWKTSFWMKLLAENGSHCRGGPCHAGYTNMDPPHLSCRNLHVASSRACQWFERAPVSSTSTFEYLGMGISSLAIYCVESCTMIVCLNGSLIHAYLPVPTSGFLNLISDILKYTSLVHY